MPSARRRSGQLLTTVNFGAARFRLADVALTWCEIPLSSIAAERVFVTGARGRRAAAQEHELDKLQPRSVPPYEPQSDPSTDGSQARRLTLTE